MISKAVLLQIDGGYQGGSCLELMVELPVRDELQGEGVFVVVLVQLVIYLDA